MAFHRYLVLFILVATCSALVVIGWSPAHTITLACLRNSAPQTCYDSAVVQVYHAQGLASAIDTLRALRHMHPTYSYCHLVATKLGMYTVEDNPLSWEEAVSTSEDASLCSYGFMHGMIIGVFGAASHTLGVDDFPTNDRLRGLCESAEMIGPRLGCYHGLGHFLMFVERGKTHAVVQRCRDVAQGEFYGTRACIEGYFMQTYARTLEEEMNLVRAPIEQPTKDTYVTWCSGFADDMVQQACFREAWALYTQEELEQGDTVKTLCNVAQGATPIEESYCYIRIAMMTLRNMLHDDARSLSVCRRYPQEFQSLCFVRGAQMVIEEDATQFTRGIRRCELVGGEDGRRCLGELARLSGRLFMPDQRHVAEAFCRRFKDADVRATCTDHLPDRTNI